MSSIISVENLSKAYRVGKKQERADSLVGMLQDSVTAPFRNWRSFRQPTSVKNETEKNNDDIHWALRDVSFEVKEGEVLGIIGRNGAGKSTLLKILSRITEPTSGCVRVRGRVSSLLEVGTGFHPELSGRENIYLNGTILGMTKREIDKKFEEIVDFSGVERFLDTPVKRYSSGMKVRLAFSVAAHLEPEILIVDEVLAVGDAEFQKKCLGKMRDVANGGRTIIFVSHDLSAIQCLCSHGLLLSNGSRQFEGEIEDCLTSYINSTPSTDDANLLETCPTNQGDIRFTGIEVTNESGEAAASLRALEPFKVTVRFQALGDLDELVIGIAVHRLDDVALFATHTNDFGTMLELKAGVWEYSVNIEPNYLRDGRYYISLGALHYRETISHIPRAFEICIEPIVNNPAQHYDKRLGLFFIPMPWRLGK